MGWYITTLKMMLVLEFCHSFRQYVRFEGIRNYLTKLPYSFTSLKSWEGHLYVQANLLSWSLWWTNKIPKIQNDSFHTLNELKFALDSFWVHFICFHKPFGPRHTHCLGEECSLFVPRCFPELLWGWNGTFCQTLPQPFAGKLNFN